MKKLLAISAALLAIGGISPAFANADDDAWISKCIKDNADQGQTSATIKSYCTCMNNQMSSSETRSITSWESTHPDEVEKCAKGAGWTGK